MTSPRNPSQTGHSPWEQQHHTHTRDIKRGSISQTFCIHAPQKTQLTCIFFFYTSGRLVCKYPHSVSVLPSFLSVCAFPEMFFVLFICQSESGRLAIFNYVWIFLLLALSRLQEIFTDVNKLWWLVKHLFECRCIE